jgi:hypothetical protein
MAWFKHSEGHLAWINTAVSTGVLDNLNRIPQGWLEAQRKQLDGMVLIERTVIEWDVPAADLQELLTGKGGGSLLSPAVYLAGTGFQLELLRKRQEDGRSHLGIYIVPCAYKQLGLQLCSAAEAVSCSFSIQRLTGATSEPERVSGGVITVIGGGTDGFGHPDFITAATPNDLSPYLVNGSLMLRAGVRPVHQR